MVTATAATKNVFRDNCMDFSLRKGWIVHAASAAVHVEWHVMNLPNVP